MPHIVAPLLKTPCRGFLPLAEENEVHWPALPVKVSAALSQDFANALLEEGIYVIGFYYPVVPKGKSRIRVQISAAHTTEHIDFALDKFKKVGQRLGALS